MRRRRSLDGMPAKVHTGAVRAVSLCVAADLAPCLSARWTLNAENRTTIRAWPDSAGCCPARRSVHQSPSVGQPGFLCEEYAHAQRGVDFRFHPCRDLRSLRWPHRRTDQGSAWRVDWLGAAGTIGLEGARWRGQRRSSAGWCRPRRPPLRFLEAAKSTHSRCCGLVALPFAEDRTHTGAGRLLAERGVASHQVQAQEAQGRGFGGFARQGGKERHPAT